jgi:hypothetical protein
MSRFDDLSDEHGVVPDCRRSWIVTSIDAADPSQGQSDPTYPERGGRRR